jgi:2-phospho-L-lactate guanylyltransferase
MRLAAERVLAAAAGSEAEPVVVTGDPAVADWATGLGATVIAETPGAGLNGAAAEAVAYAQAREAPWCIAHADLPLLESRDLTEALRVAHAAGYALAPSRSGGTNLLAGLLPIEFAYGQGSFRRHLAAAQPETTEVVVSVATALDLDTIDDVVAASTLPGGAWLEEFLG